MRIPRPQSSQLLSIIGASCSAVVGTLPHDRGSLLSIQLALQPSVWEDLRTHQKGTTHFITWLVCGVQLVRTTDPLIERRYMLVAGGVMRIPRH